MSHRALGQQFAAAKGKAVDVALEVGRVGFFIKGIVQSRPTMWHDETNPVLRALSSDPTTGKVRSPRIPGVR